MSSTTSRRPLALAIHGGAGVIEQGSLVPEVEAAIHADLARALDVGHAILATGGSALDDGVAEVRCEFCGQQYRFTSPQIEELFEHPAVDMEAPARLQ